LLFTPVSDIESGIEDVTENMVRFSVVDGMLLCHGNFDASAVLSVYNMGGVKVASAAVAGDCGTVSMDVNHIPHGSYIVVVKGDSESRVYKIVL
jgi:hypothetical protein